MHQKKRKKKSIRKPGHVETPLKSHMHMRVRES